MCVTHTCKVVFTKKSAFYSILIFFFSVLQDDLYTSSPFVTPVKFGENCSLKLIIKQLFGDETSRVEKKLLIL